MLQLFVNSFVFQLATERKPFTLFLLLHHLILQRCVNVNSLLIWYPWVSIWTVEDQKGPQDEPQQADRSWTNVVRQNRLQWKQIPAEDEEEPVQHNYNIVLLLNWDVTRWMFFSKMYYQIYKRRRSNPGKSRFHQRQEEQWPSPAGFLIQNNK